MQDSGEDQATTDPCGDPAADVKRKRHCIKPPTTDRLVSAIFALPSKRLIKVSRASDRDRQDSDTRNRNARIQQDATGALFLKSFALVLLEDILGVGKGDGLKSKGFHQASLTRADLVDGLGLFVALL